MALIGAETKRSGRVTDPDGRQVNIDAGGIADTVAQGASTPAPAINTTLAFVAATVGAVYKLRVTIALTGTAETALANLAIRNNAVSFSVLPSLSGSIVQLDFPRITAAGGFTVTNTAAATAGSIYTLHLTATRVE